MKSLDGYFQDDMRLNDLTTPREQQVLNQELFNTIFYSTWGLLDNTHMGRADSARPPVTQPFYKIWI